MKYFRMKLLFILFFILRGIQQKSRKLNEIAIAIEIVVAILFLIFATLKIKTHKL
jgi:O-antigen/teichoic acid export membrane protein